MFRLNAKDAAFPSGQAQLLTIGRTLGLGSPFAALDGPRTA